MKTRIPILMIALALLLGACGGTMAPSRNQSMAAPTMAPAAPAPSEAQGGNALDSANAPGAVAREEAQAPITDQTVASGADRLVIKTAQLTLEVESVRDAEAAVRAKVNELGGYIVTAQTNGTEPNMYTDIVFRVPSARFDEALSGVQGMAKRVLNRSLGGEDVTEEFVDLESRLRNLEATRTRLLDLLEKANRVEDALAVNQALTDVQGQIEQIKGRMQYLQTSASMATISVSLRPVPLTPIIDENSWQPGEVFRRALRDLIEFGEDLVEFLIVLAVWSPVWLPIVLLGRWGWKRMMRMFAKPIRTTPPPQNPENQG